MTRPAASKRIDFVPADEVVLHVSGDLCADARALLGSDAFSEIVGRYVESMAADGSPLLDLLVGPEGPEAAGDRLTSLLALLADTPIGRVERRALGSLDAERADHREALFALVEGLYDFWRHFDRFLVYHVPERPAPDEGSRPHREFNAAAERLQALVRGLYRDIEENITGEHPRVYRQVAAAWNAGVLAVPCPWEAPSKYRGSLAGIDTIRQVVMNPPLILDPPTNTRTGSFMRVDEDPLDGMSIDPSEWLCYPAQVGPVVVFVYFHQSFIGLGCSLANLFDLVDDERLEAGPDAVYLFGAPPESLAGFGEIPTVFFDDPDTGLLVAAVPGEPRFGYFGYLKKMVLTLHNVVMMRDGRMPFHGALSHLELRDGRQATVLLIGDTATGKSETLEALRQLGHGTIRDLRIVADDMGHLEIGDDGALVGFGTEVGAFIRLDDLQQGYAWGQVDRAIIMSPQKVNARVVLPVTTLSEVLRGYPVDFLLYANNYEQVDEAHPVIERFASAAQALRVFREGAAMSKGTTTSTGLTHSYFANIFGPAQYEADHERIAIGVFEAAFEEGVFVGQLRTRLGMVGYETEGPMAAAEALIEAIGARP